MAQSVDESVVFVTGTGTTVVTASFTPLDNCILVVCGFCNGEGAEVLAITDSVDGATGWTTRVIRNSTEAGQDNGVAVIATKEFTTGHAARTVTMTRSGGTGANHKGMKVYQITDYDTSDPVDVVGENDTTTNDLTTTVFTATKAGRAYAAYGDWNASGAPATSDETGEYTYHSAGNYSGMVHKKSAGHAAGAVSMNFNGGGTAGVAAVWVAIAIADAAAGGAVPIAAKSMYYHLAGGMRHHRETERRPSGLYVVKGGYDLRNLRRAA